MRKNIKYYMIIMALTVSFSGCEDYLNIPAEAALYEEDVFKTYEAFQGYQDQIMVRIIDYHRHGARAQMSLGGECVSREGQSVFLSNLGLYSQSQNGLMSKQSCYLHNNDGSAHEQSRYGIYISIIIS